jgi:hypothetical protein
MGELSHRAAFLEAGRALLVSPTPAQQEYLAAVSQGYFLEHLLGLDPDCTAVRQELFEDTFWICDSSVLLPLCARGALDHEFAQDLFSRFAERGVAIYTTERLLGEAWRHLEWAIEFVEENGIESIEFLAAALTKDGYGQNLFIDGYIRLAAGGDVGSFQDYIESVCPGGQSRARLAEALELNGLHVLRDYDLGDLADLQNAISADRQSRGTFKNDYQVITEAEVLEYARLLLEGEITPPVSESGSTPRKCYFISHSRVLDRAKRDVDRLTTWTPEAVYRLVTSLPGAPLDAALLQQCMLNEYYYAGVSFIDRASYVRFFGPAISQSRLQFEEEKDAYVAAVSAVGAEQLEAEYEGTDDLLKPFFSSQMGWRLARTATSNAQAASADAARAVLESQKKIRENDAAWEQKLKDVQAQSGAQKRNAEDPKHVRKRARQAKKRKKG